MRAEENAERPKRYSDRSRELLREAWLLMDMPCGKYLKAILPHWLPALHEAGELDAYDGSAFRELASMSAATIDRYLRPVRDAARPGNRGHAPGG